MAPGSLKVLVAATSTRQEEGSGKTYVVYRVDCHAEVNGALLATRWRRYREFEALAFRLRTCGAPKLHLPPKTMGRRATNVEKRRESLESSLNRYLSSPIPVPPVLAEWLGVHASLPAGHEGPEGGSTEERLQALRTDVLHRVVALVEAHAAAELDKKITRRMSDFHTMFRQVSTIALVLFVFVAEGDRLRAVVLSSALCAAIAWICASYAWRRAVAAAVSELVAERGDAGVSGDAAQDGPTQGGKLAVDPSHELLTQVAVLLGLETPALGAAGDSDAVGATPVEPALEGTLAELPEKWKTEMEHACELLRLNARSDLNSEGQPWYRADGQGHRPGVAISSSAVPGRACRIWKSEMEITADVDVSEMGRFLSHWPTRLEWDAVLSSAGTVKRFDGGYDVSFFLSRPAAGGAISPRQYIILRRHRQFDVGTDGLRGYESISITLPANDPLCNSVPRDSKVIIAESLPGTGVRILPLSPGPDGRKRWMVQTLCNTDIKGWLPVRVINLAMNGSLTDACENLASYMIRSFPAGVVSLADGQG